MALKKSELYSSLWKSCDELRGGMDASQYKDYVLVLLFVKYVSDKNAGGAKGLLEVPTGTTFPDLVTLKGDPAIGEQMTVKITALFTANGLSLSDVPDFNDPEKLGKGKEMVDRLSNLIGIFDTPDLDFRGNRAAGDDLLGDAYEFLMRHFATESGKSKGQFYTPAEVSRVMAKVVGVGGAKARTQTIYDPTCGSGSLLLKAHDEAQSATGHDLALYGQEMDQQTSGLARMNMMLHNCPTAEIWKDNVLAAPHFQDAAGRLKAFDFVVANPPFSFKSWTSGFTPSADPFDRFALGVPPAKNGDMAFLLHILASLKSTGKAAVNLPHGVLFRGNAEAAIRRQIVQRGYVKAVVGLPPNLFYGTGIPACIVVLDKENADHRKGVFLIDASKGFVKDGNKNRLRAQDIHRIVDAFTRFADTPKYSRMVPLSEIADPKNDYNLNIPRYVDASEPEDLQDIGGHLRGGIPVRDVDALADYWAVFPGVREALFRTGDRPCYLELAVPPADIKAAIFGHKTFTKFQKSVVALFEVWTEKNKPKLRDIKKDVTRPKTLIEELSEVLLGTFRDVRLIDPYDVYQHLMTYWAETMQDDVYAVAADGWVPAAQPRRIVEVKGKKTTEKPDLVVNRQKFKTELVPLPLLVARYFAAEQERINAHTAEEEKAAQQLEELREEHGGEDGLLADVTDDKGKVTKGAVTERLKKIKADKDAADERAMLAKYQTIMDEESEAERKAKEALAELHEKALAKYGALTDDDVKALVVEDKWLAALAADVRDELDRVSRALTGRVAELAARYATPLPTLAAEADTLAKRVHKHLAKMGAA